MAMNPGSGQQQCVILVPSQAETFRLADEREFCHVAPLET
jgi:hypothetical protein